MKDTRVGEQLWQQWHGEGYFSDTHSEIIYFTHDHVDIDNEIVRRALASTLQRDGVVDGLAHGFKALEDASIDFGFAGIIEGEKEYTVCDEEAETEYGDLVEKAFPITWIEF